MQIGQCLKQASSQLDQSLDIDSGRIDAEILLCQVLDKPRSYLFSHSDEHLSPEQLAALGLLLQRRLAGEPVAYIVGCREFWSLDFLVNPDVLIPRPDTECLIEKVLQLPLPDNARVVDLGVGSGAIAIALASERPRWCCVGIDISGGALAVANQNRKRLLSHGHCSLVEGKWLDAVASGSAELIVSNPPYIEESDPHLTMGDVRFEPQSALTSGEDGLEDLRVICREAQRVLVPGGYLVVEHGWRQQAQVVELFESGGFVSVERGRDLSGRARYVAGCLPLACSD